MSKDDRQGTHLRLEGPRMVDGRGRDGRYCLQRYVHIPRGSSRARSAGGRPRKRTRGNELFRSWSEPIRSRGCIELPRRIGALLRRQFRLRIASLREYHGKAGMIGMEPTFHEHLANLVKVFPEVRRVLPDSWSRSLHSGSRERHWP